MKEIIAIIRPEQWNATKGKLTELGLPYTQCRVYGRGKQRGLKYLSRSKSGALTQTGVRYVPKRCVILVVSDERVEATVQALIQINQTGSIGDGKIFVSPLEEAVRIRTGETGAVSLA